jgi:hypothetical protein
MSHGLVLRNELLVAAMVLFNHRMEGNRVSKQEAIACQFV